jgi:hypothetical protein
MDRAASRQRRPDRHCGPGLFGGSLRHGRRFGLRLRGYPFFSGRRGLLGHRFPIFSRLLAGGRFFNSGLGTRCVEPVQPPELHRHVFINRAGVRLLLRDAELGKPLQYFVGFHFQLPRQLVDTNLFHRQSGL